MVGVTSAGKYLTLVFAMLARGGLSEQEDVGSGRRAEQRADHRVCRGEDVDVVRRRADQPQRRVALLPALRCQPRRGDGAVDGTSGRSLIFTKSTLGGQTTGDGRVRRTWRSRASCWSRPAPLPCRT